MCGTHDGQCGWGVGGAMSVLKSLPPASVKLGRPCSVSLEI